MKQLRNSPNFLKPIPLLFICIYIEILNHEHVFIIPQHLARECRHFVENGRKLLLFGGLWILNQIFFSAKGKKKKIHSRILRLHYILHEQRKSVLSNSISCPLFLTRFLPFIYAYVKLIAEPINLISNITK